MRDIALNGCATCPLRRDALLRHLDATGWKTFLAARTARFYRRNNVLFYEGNRPLGVFFLCAGRIKLVCGDCGRRQQIVRIMRAPDVVGLRSLIADEPYAATGVVMEDSRICQVEARRFLDFLRGSPDGALALARRFARDLGDAEALAAELSMHTVRERLAKFLLETWLHSRDGGRADRVLLNECRSEMAEILGTSLEAVCRGLAEFRAKGWIELDGQRLRVLEESRLRAAMRDSRLLQP